MKIKVAATQMTCDWEIENNIKKSIHLIEKAAEQGANIILLQELFQTPYFCIQYDEAIFKLAQPFENNTLINKMSEVAKKHKVVLPISFFEKDNNAYFNSIAVIDADGKILGKYRKSVVRIGRYPLYDYRERIGQAVKCLEWRPLDKAIPKNDARGNSDYQEPVF